MGCHIGGGQGGGRHGWQGFPHQIVTAGPRLPWWPPKEIAPPWAIAALTANIVSKTAMSFVLTFVHRPLQVLCIT
jgi:hypothetical protein